MRPMVDPADQIEELKKLRKVLTIIAKVLIQRQDPTVGTELLLQELEKLK